MIRGPKDKSLFRNDPTNWTGYVDPLPACHIAEGGDREYPSVSSIKQAWPKNLTDWAAKEAAKSAWKHRNALVDMTEAEALDLIAPASDRQRDAAAGRGHTVHDLLEHHLQLDRGILLLPDDDPARAYLDTVRTIVEREQPEVLASEVIVFGEWTDDRGLVHHWSGTFDAIWRVAEHNVLVDYKSRKLSKAATRYPEEGAQLGAYSAARYWIVEDDEHGMHRMLPLQIDAAMILSIAPDAYGKYLVEDIDHARRVWHSTLQFRHTQKSAPAMFARVVKHTVEGGGAAGSATHGVATPPNTPAVEVEPSATAPTTAGKPAGATSPAPAGDPSPLTDSLDAVLHQARVAWVLNRIEAVKERGEDATRRLGTAMPDGPTPKAVREGTPWTAVQLEAWNAHVTAVEAEFELPFSDEDPAVAAERAAERAATEAARVAAPVAAPAAESAPVTEEGGPFADPDEVASIRAVLASMNDEPAQRGLVEHVFGWTRTGLDTGHPWSLSPKGQPTPLRRWAICAAAIGLLDIVDLDAEDPDAAVRLALALVVGDDALKPSVPVGQTLGTLTFDEAQRVAAVVDTHRLVPGPDGTPRLEVVA